MTKKEITTSIQPLLNLWIAGFVLHLIGYSICTLNIFSTVIYCCFSINPYSAIIAVNRSLYTKATAALFIASQLILFDIIMNQFSYFSFIVAAIYACIEFSILDFMQQKTYSFGSVMGHALLVMLLFDVTGCLIGPLFFEQSLTTALIGQIPFTISNIVKTGMLTTVFFILKNFHMHIWNLLPLSRFNKERKLWN